MHFQVEFCTADQPSSQLCRGRAKERPRLQTKTRQLSNQHCLLHLSADRYMYPPKSLTFTHPPHTVVWLSLRGVLFSAIGVLHSSQVKGGELMLPG